MTFRPAKTDMGQVARRRSSPAPHCSAGFHADRLAHRASRSRDTARHPSSASRTRKGSATHPYEQQRVGPPPIQSTPARSSADPAGRPPPPDAPLTVPQIRQDWTLEHHTAKRRWSFVESPRAACIHVADDEPYYAPPGRIVASVPGHRRGAGPGMPVRWLGVSDRVREDLQGIVNKLNAYDELVKALEKIRAEESCSPVIAFIADAAIKLTKAGGQ